MESTGGEREREGWGSGGRCRELTRTLSERQLAEQDWGILSSVQNVTNVEQEKNTENARFKLLSQQIAKQQW